MVRSGVLCAAVAAHARFTSVLFDIVTITTIVVYGIRVIMGYKKMYDRYKGLQLHFGP